MFWNPLFLQNQMKTVISQSYFGEFCFFGKIRQTKAGEITQDFYQGESWTQPCVCWGIPLASRGSFLTNFQINFQTSHRTFPAGAGTMSKGTEKWKQRTDMTLKTLSVPWVSVSCGFNNELAQSSVTHEGKIGTHKRKLTDSFRFLYSRKAACDWLGSRFCHLKPASY